MLLIQTSRIAKSFGLSPSVPRYLLYLNVPATAYLVQCTLGAIANSAKANQRHKYQTSTINAMVPGRKVALPLEGIVPILL